MTVSSADGGRLTVSEGEAIVSANDTDVNDVMVVEEETSKKI
jgi:hypothetical protein